MKRRLVSLALALALALPLTGTSAEGEDTAVAATGSALVGQQFVVTVEVHTVEGAQVEVDPAAESWAGVEFVRLQSAATTNTGGMSVHRLELVVAGFFPGGVTFAPAVNVVEGVASTPRVLPAVALVVLPTLRPEDPAELSPLPAPEGIGGAESSLLRPAIGAGVVTGAALAALALFLGGRWLAGRKRPLPVPAAPVAAPPDLGAAAALMDADPARAYRVLAATVRGALTDRYGIPAVALTSSEVGRRMESAGIDRWQARLVAGLLQECDAVVYAGYRPARERRDADLVAAREIVEAGA